MSSSMADGEASLNIPSIITFAVVSFFVLRWLFSSRTSSTSSDNAQSGRAGPPRVDTVQLDHLAQMFPQLTRRELLWDLQRNGGSVAATTERVLTGRGLESPPPTFQPNLPASSTPVETPRRAAKPARGNLISRYNLQSRIEETSTGAATEPVTDDLAALRKDSAWSRDKLERQRLMQKRRDDMILSARRKMLEKDKASKQQQQQPQQ